MATASVTNSFSVSTKAKSAEVNTNFQELVTFLNAQVVHVDGSKAFTAVPTGPATDPSTDNHLSRKKYVDDQVATKADTSHVHAGTDITTGTVAAARLPNLGSMNGQLPASKVDVGSFGGSGAATFPGVVRADGGSSAPQFGFDDATTSGLGRSGGNVILYSQASSKFWVNGDASSGGLFCKVGTGGVVSTAGGGTWKFVVMDTSNGQLGYLP